MKEQRGFQRIYFLKLTDASAKGALWLRFTVLTSANGFRKVAETWAVQSTRGEDREMEKVALRQTHDYKTFVERSSGPVPANNEYSSSRSSREGSRDATAAPFGVKVGTDETLCELDAHGSRGVIVSKGRTFRWDLRIASAEGTPGFTWLPEVLARAGAGRMQGRTLLEDLRVSGETELDGVTTTWTAATGVLGRITGAGYAHSWVWGHCNAFVNERGEPADCIFDGWSARARLGGWIPSPRFSPMFFRYQGQDYRLNSLWNALRSRSEHNLTGWKFQAEHGDLSFRGQIRAEHRDFAGVTYEDTDGSFLYGSNSELSDMTLWVYRRGKLETTLNAKGTATLELVSRVKNPYVPLLI